MTHARHIVFLRSLKSRPGRVSSHAAGARRLQQVTDGRVQHCLQGITMDKWEFVTVRTIGTGSVSWLWQWRRVQESGETVSEKTFTTFPECVADARRHGFHGTIEPGGGWFDRPQSKVLF